MDGFKYIRPLGASTSGGWQESEEEDNNSSTEKLTYATESERDRESSASDSETDDKVTSSSDSENPGDQSTDSEDDARRANKKKKKKSSVDAKGKKKKYKPSKRERNEVKKIQSWPGGEFKGDNEKHSPRDLFKLWADWSDNFKNVLKLKDIKSQENMLGLLLIYGGTMIRKVYETATLAIGGKKKSSGLKCFDKAWKIIDGHFRGLGSDDQERNTLQQMRMKEGEKFPDWLLRLNEQLNLCNFSEKRREEELRYAVIYRSIEKISEELEMGSSENKTVHALIQHAIVIDRRLSRKREEETMKKEPIDVLAVGSSQKRKLVGEGERGGLRLH